MLDEEEVAFPPAGGWLGGLSNAVDGDVVGVLDADDLADLAAAVDDDNTESFGFESRFNLAAAACEEPPTCCVCICVGPAAFKGSSLYLDIVDGGDELTIGLEATDELRAMSDSEISLNEVLISCDMTIAPVPAPAAAEALFVLL